MCCHYILNPPRTGGLKLVLRARDKAPNSALKSQDGPLLITLTMQRTTFYAEAFNEINSDTVKTSFLSQKKTDIRHII